MARIVGVEFFPGFDALTSNDQVMLAAQFLAYFIQGIFHAATVGRVVFEIAQGLVFELGELHGCASTGKVADAHYSAAQSDT